MRRCGLAVISRFVNCSTRLPRVQTCFACFLGVAAEVCIVFTQHARDGQRHTVVGQGRVIELQARDLQYAKVEGRRILWYYLESVGGTALGLCSWPCDDAENCLDIQ
jgi:hypothetical protein